LGKKIKNLATGKLTAGLYSVIWDGTNDQGTAVSSGLYFIIINLGLKMEKKKALLIK
jgi:flagellar hook assembly protein FlgD